MGLKRKLITLGVTAGLLGGGCGAKELLFSSEHNYAVDLLAEPMGQQEWQSWQSLITGSPVGLDDMVIVCPSNIPDCSPNQALYTRTDARWDPLGEDEVNQTTINAFVAREDKALWVRNGANDSRALAGCKAKQSLPGIVQWPLKKVGIIEGAKCHGSSIINTAVSLEYHLPQHPNHGQGIFELRLSDADLKYKQVPGLTGDKERDKSKRNMFSLRKLMDYAPYSPNIFGIKTFGQAAFGVEPKDFSNAQGAMAAAAIRSPGTQNSTSPEKRNGLIDAMNNTLAAEKGLGYLTQAEVDQAKQECNHENGCPMLHDTTGYGNGSVTYNSALGMQPVVGYVLQQVANKIPSTGGEASKIPPGTRIVASIDSNLQAAARKAIANANLPGEVAMALTSIDKKGYIRAMAQSELPDNIRLVNLNLGKTGGAEERNFGSAGKVFLWGEAKDKGELLFEYPVPNEINFPNANNSEDYPVHGRGCKQNGVVSDPCNSAFALASSSDIVAAEIAQQRGGTKPMLDLMREFGFEEIEPGADNISAIVGGMPATPREAAQAMAGLMLNRGRPVEETSIIEKIYIDGEEKEAPSPRVSDKQAISKEAADWVIDAARGVVAPGGTAGRTVTYDDEYDVDISGKTGTDGELKDNDEPEAGTPRNNNTWFNGVTCGEFGDPEKGNSKSGYSVSVWAGSPTSNAAVVPWVGGAVNAAVFNDFISNTPQNKREECSLTSD